MAKGKAGKKKQAWERKELEPREDAIINRNETCESDIVIPVMGPTGVGKSTFINALLGRPTMPIGHDLKYCTTNLQHTLISDIPNRPSLNGRRIVIVDTPGFDSTYAEDREILRRIAVWLASSYDADMKLSGLIYLHDISQARVQVGATRMNVEMFRELCGNGAASVIIGTTKWEGVQSDVGKRREDQLSLAYWKDMIASGSKMQRFNGTHESAWQIVHCILQKLEESDALRIQNERVNSNLHQRHGCKMITKDIGVMILVLGQTGVGKSAFINKVAGRDVAKVGHDLQRCTSDVKPFIIGHYEDPSRRVIFVDTPGFNSDGIWLDDKQILQQILGWLRTACDQDVRFGGILYLHDITMCRDAAGASDMTSIKLSVPEIARHVLLATVKWNEPESPQQRRREQLMIINWKNSIDRGAQVARLKSTISPWSIVDTLLKSPVELGIIRRKLDSTLGELSKKPAKGRTREFFSSLFRYVGIPQSN